MDLGLKFVGDDCLTLPSKTIDKIDDSIIELAESMKDYMVQCNGIGLAAPQVGRNIRLIVVKLSTGITEAMINPRISWTSDSRVKMEEGCLSIPDKLVWIDRPSKVRVKFQTLEGDFKYWCLHKMDARVFLHEYDHLEGILMTERL